MVAVTEESCDDRAENRCKVHDGNCQGACKLAGAQAAGVRWQINRWQEVSQDLISISELVYDIYFVGKEIEIQSIVRDIFGDSVEAEK